MSVSLPPVSEAEAYMGALPSGGGGGAGGGARGAKRPLGRTHSAPLPLGDPALQPHHYLRDQIRKTVSLLILYNRTNTECSYVVGVS